MGDIKLFRTTNSTVTELQGSGVTLEKSLQDLIEKNMDSFLGVRYLASEYSTGQKHGGRIDSLGIDENGCPVIIEYKRSLNENVINQGLYYLDWLMDHKAEFTLLVMKQQGDDVAETIDWSAPRLLCIAGDFTKYDEHAVSQINRNIELLRYRRYGEEYLLLELVNSSSAQSTGNGGGVSSSPGTYKTVTEYLADASPDLRDVFESLKAFLTSLGDEVQFKTLKYYFAFKRLKNFACVEVQPQSNLLACYVKVNPDTVELEEGFTRDVRNIGHYGTGDLEIRIRSESDLERAKELLVNSFEAS